jgi:hypothetical protein
MEGEKMKGPRNFEEFMGDGEGIRIGKECRLFHDWYVSGYQVQTCRKCGKTQWESGRSYNPPGFKDGFRIEGWRPPAKSLRMVELQQKLPPAETVDFVALRNAMETTGLISLVPDLLARAEKNEHSEQAVSSYLKGATPQHYRVMAHWYENGWVEWQFASLEELFDALWPLREKTK